MFTRQEASRIKHSFWTTFGKYMSPVSSADGLKINWVNYHTGVKDLYFRMNASNRNASIAISIEHRDPEIQQLYFEQFIPLKTLLHSALEEEWTWKMFDEVDGKIVSRIFCELDGVSVFNQDDWPSLISFFKPRIIALDAFWADAKYGFSF